MNEPTPRRDGDDWYRIRLQGRLDARWATWFDEMQLSSDEDGTTVLQGRVQDQAALHGLLAKIRDMGLPLLSVVRGGPGASTRHPNRSEPRQEPRR
jgi:hypothetical protein